MTPRWRRARATTRTTTPTATSARREGTREDRNPALAPGLRLKRGPSGGRTARLAGVVAVLAGGLLLGAALNGAPPLAVVGTLAVAVAAGAAIYRPALGLAILAFTYPFDLTVYAGPLKLTSSEGLIGILALVWLGRQVLRNPPGWQRTQLDLPVLVFAGATVVSILGLTGFYQDQLIGLLKAAGGFVLFYIATQSLKKRADLWLVVGAVVATGLIQAVQTVVPVVTGSQAVSEQTRATGSVIDPNLFAGYLVLVIPLAIALGIVLRRWWAIPTAVLTTVIFAAALVATLSRSGWLGLLVAMVALALLLPERRRHVAIIAASLVAVFLVGGLAGPIADRLGSHDQGLWETLLARFPIWGTAVAMFVQHPVFGIGVNNFGNLVDSYDPSLGVNQAHNIFLNMAAERGIIGVVVFIVLLVLLFQVLVRAFELAPRSPYRVLTAGLIAAFAAFLAHSLFDVSYYDYKILLLFWLLCGMAASLPRVYSGADLK